MSGVRWWSLVWCTRISRRPRTPKARTKEFLTSFSVHVLRTRTIPIHTHTYISRQYAPCTRGDEREREIAHQSYDNILNLPTANFRQRDRRREWEQLAGVDGAGNADAAPSKEPRTSALWIHTHTHMCTQWGSDSQPPFEISSSRILYTLPSCHFLTHFSLHSSRSGEETETRVRSGVNFFFFLFLLFLSPWSWLMDWSIIFSSIRWAL